MWYALVDANALGLKLEPDSVSELLRAGSAIKTKLKEVLAGNALIGDDPAPRKWLHSMSRRSHKTRNVLVSMQAVPAEPKVM